jgi:crossover junction endodeoxyribonuclease RuvC
MRVLGLDPGLAITGYGIVDSDGQALSSVTYGVIRTPAKTPHADRLATIHQELTRLINEHEPDLAAVEQLFFCTNVRTAMIVGEARGVLLLTLALADMTIAEYTPLQIKQAVTGYGQASKDQVQQMVQLLLELDETPRPDDAADALAVSICHHHTARMDALLNQG